MSVVLEIFCDYEGKSLDFEITRDLDITILDFDEDEALTLEEMGYAVHPCVNLKRRMQEQPAILVIDLINSGIDVDLLLQVGMEQLERVIPCWSEVYSKRDEPQRVVEMVQSILYGGIVSEEEFDDLESDVNIACDDAGADAWRRGSRDDDRAAKSVCKAALDLIRMAHLFYIRPWYFPRGAQLKAEKGIKDVMGKCVRAVQERADFQGKDRTKAGILENAWQARRLIELLEQQQLAEDFED